MENSTFNGTFNVGIPAEKCLSMFSDPMPLSKCIWGLESIERDGSDFSCHVRFDVSDAGVSYLSTISGKLKIHYTVEGNSLNLQGQGRVAGSKLAFTLNLLVIDKSGNTEISWKGSFDFGLLIRSMGKDKIEKVSRSNIEKTISCIKEKMNSGLKN
ncbi:SRPBCC domain-containing protein [Oxyplasma meridianum]|uniref:SRPBCC domain-containing protein n=1 Tax=Oxyplasma meridianum TaxID=3073602 RepID=A0AAX4NIG6_9ARCH